MALHTAWLVELGVGHLAVETHATGLHLPRSLFRMCQEEGGVSQRSGTMRACSPRLAVSARGWRCPSMPSSRPAAGDAEFLAVCVSLIGFIVL